MCKYLQISVNFTLQIQSVFAIVYALCLLSAASVSPGPVPKQHHHNNLVVCSQTPLSRNRAT